MIHREYRHYMKISERMESPPKLGAYHDNINTAGNPLDYLPYKIICVIIHHSNSTVPVGFGVKSYSTRLIPATSWVIRSVI